MSSPRVKFIKSIGFKGTLGLLAIALGILFGVVFVVNTDGKNLVIAESSDKMEQIVNTAVENLSTRAQEIAALVRTMAAVTEELPKQSDTFMQTLPPVIDFDGDLKVAGGGYWPEPGYFKDDVRRHSFFWGREADNSFKYYDDYNGVGPVYDEGRFDSDPQYQQNFLASPGYHNEEWYVVVRYTEPGTCVWSSSYMDPYSFQPMVTCTVGTYDRAHRLTGTVTIDLKLEGLENDVMAWEKKTGGYLMVLDRNGTFLSFPKAGDKAKVISVDGEGNKSEAFKSAQSFGEEQPLFKPIADAVANMNDQILAQAKQMPGFDATLADKIDRDSYQIDRQNAEFLAALLADPLAEATQKTFLFDTITIEDDFLLGESALVFIFHVPNSYWKYVLVKPLSEATAVATNLANTLKTKISILIAAVIALAYLALRMSLVRRLRSIASRVHVMGELVSEGKVSELRQVKVSQYGSDELGLLSEVVNSISDEFADKHQQVQEMNRTLEQKVAERTQELAKKARDIQSILENLNQGVFTVLEDKTIHPEYACYLEEILQTDQIAGQGFLSLVFKPTGLSCDQLDQLDTAVSAMIGEQQMMYEFNEHLLPTEVVLMLEGQSEKILEVDWDPIVNEDDVVEKLLVTLRDVTQLRALQSEAEHQKRELALIGQILGVSQEKFHEFVESSRQFLADNRQLLEANPDKNLDCIAELFRNMHTIKGNARTYGLLHLDGFGA